MGESYLSCGIHSLAASLNRRIAMVGIVRSRGAKAIQKFTNATLDNERAVDPKRLIFELRTSHWKPSGFRGYDGGVFWLVALHFCECQAIDLITHEVTRGGVLGVDRIALHSNIEATYVYERLVPQTVRQTDPLTSPWASPLIPSLISLSFVHPRDLSLQLSTPVMSDSLRKPRFDSSYAPESLFSAYHKERVVFAGMFTAAVFYGGSNRSFVGHSS